MFVDREKVIKTVKSGEAISSLFNNERNKRITNPGRCFFYLDNQNKWKPLKGLLPTLEKVYWFNTNINKLTNPSTSNKISKKKKKEVKIKKEKIEKRGRYGGIILGKDIHKQLEDFIILDKKNFKRLHEKGLHIYAEKLLKYITGDLSLQPLKGEFNIYDEVLNIGTSIDMICTNREGKLIFLEFKTGYKNYFENNDGVLDKSLTFMKNSPMNWATVQLVSSIIILIKNYNINIKDIDRSYILRIDNESNKPDCYPIENEFIVKISNHIYNDLLNENIKDDK